LKCHALLSLPLKKPLLLPLLRLPLLLLQLPVLKNLKLLRRKKAKSNLNSITSKNPVPLLGQDFLF
jgi:hypothetical protein